jgi:hypothetical protein
LFELSKDRADFVSRLFSRKRPDGLTARSSASEIFDAFRSSEGSREMYEANLQAVLDQLTKKHAFPLSDGDRDGIKWAMSNYYRFGPSINYSSSLSAGTPPDIVGATGGIRGGNMVNYATLMTVDDGRGEYRSYLANEENFQYLKDLETHNLVIPVVGDFGGNKAIRAVARYLKSIDAMVSAFYLSNVEQFLVQDGNWDRFCASTSMLPLDESSVFIRTGRGGPYTIGGGGGIQNSSTANMLMELAACRDSK